MHSPAAFLCRLVKQERSRVPKHRLEPIEARTKSLRTINTFFRALEVAQGLVNSPQVDGGLRVIAGLDLRRAELLADAQGALMHGLSAVHVQIGVVEHSEVIVA